MIQTLTAPGQRRKLPEAPPAAPEGGPAPTAPLPLPAALPQARQRLPFIDGLRGVALLMVLGFHGWQSCGSILTQPPGRWTAGLFLLLQHGYLGVHLFLVLSGFCLTLPLVCEGRTEPRLDWRRFWGRRARRILPPYYLALILFSLRPVLEGALRAALGRPHPFRHLYTAGEILSHALMVHNFSQDWVRTINGSFWSLALEWQLYLLFPLLVGSFRRWGAARTLAAALILSLTYRTWVYAAHVGPGSRPYSPLQVTACVCAYAQVPGRLVEFVLGMIAAVALARRWGSDPASLPAQLTPDPASRYLAGFVALGALGIWLTHAWSPFAPVTDIVWGMAFFCLVMYGGVRAAGGGWLEARPLVALGTISYSVYLIHEPLLRRAEATLGPHHLSTAANLLLFGTVLAPLAVGCGWLYFLAVEARFLRRGSRAS